MRFGGLGGWEWIIILMIVILLFGGSRLAGVGAALGQSIKEFRDAVGGGDKDKDKDKSSEEDKEQTKED